MDPRAGSRWIAWLASALALGLAIALPAAAQEAADGTLPEIVVTAQKRASTADRTPISMSAVSGDELEDRGIAEFSALAAQTPGVSMKINGPGQTEFEMRGMTSSGGNSPTVGFYLDDVPLTPPASAQNGKVVIDPALYDLNRIEVLRGPQGTLYGAGSMGGTIKLVTNQPDLAAFAASAQAVVSATDGGGFNHAENAMLNVPLVHERLGMRLVATQSSTSGWIDRIVVGDFPQPGNGGNTRGDVLAAPVLADDKQSNAATLQGVRLSLAWQPTQRLTIAPSIFYQRITQNGPSAFDSDPGTLAHYQPFPIAEPYSDSITVNTLTGSYRFESFDVTSVTAFWHRVSRQTQDGSENFENSLDGFGNTGTFYGPDGTGPISGTEIDPSQQFSQELRAASSGDGPLSWVGGVFFSRFRSNWELYTDVPNPAAFFVTIDNVWTVQQPDEITQSALFGETSYALTERLKLTAGLRWYDYRNQLDMSFSGFGSPSGTNTPIVTTVDESNTGTNPKLALSYEADRDTLVYATAARGFRPGGGNQPLPVDSPTVGACIQHGLALLGYQGAAPLGYAPDSVWSYEAGEKARMLARRVQLNSSVYFEDWRDIQLEELPCDYPLYDNADSAHVYGGEIEVRASLGAGWTLAASGGYTHAELAETSHGFRAGDRLPDVPAWTASLDLGYRTPLGGGVEFVARAQNVYTGARVDLTFPGGEPDTQTPLPGYDLTNARVGLASQDGWTAYLFANNLFNRHAALENIIELTLANASFNRVETNQPLTIGIDVSYRF